MGALSATSARASRACGRSALAQPHAAPGEGIPEGFDTQFLLRRGSETHAESPSIGSERKTYFPIRHVNYPVASVILHFGKNNHYPIIDFRSLWSLSVPVPNYYIYAFWQSYVAYCRSLSQKAKLDMRTIDRALWQYSKENDKETS